MPNSTESSRYHRLFGRARGGDEAAFYELYDELAEPLLRMADCEIGDWLRRHYPPQNAALSVLGSAFVGVKNGKYEHRSKREMWGWIAQRLRFHIARKVERLKAKKQQANQLAQALPPEHDQPDRPLMTHEEEVGLSDAIRYVLAEVSPEDADLITTIMESRSKTEAKDKLGITKWMLDRRLSGLRSLFEEALGQTG